MAKENKEATQCVLVLDTKKKIEKALEKTKVDDVWGIGYQYAEKLNHFGITNALQLSMKTPEFAKKHLGGIVGLRLLRELQGYVSIQMDDELITKK